MKIKPVYAAAVAYLKENPDKIRPSWVSAGDFLDRLPGGILFRFLPEGVGCLTMMKKDHIKRPFLKKAVLLEVIADDRIPAIGTNITVEELDAFAEWNSRLDDELPRETPTIPSILIPYLPKE